MIHYRVFTWVESGPDTVPVNPFKSLRGHPQDPCGAQTVRLLAVVELKIAAPLDILAQVRPQRVRLDRGRAGEKHTAHTPEEQADRAPTAVPFGAATRRATSTVSEARYRPDRCRRQRSTRAPRHVSICPCPVRTRRFLEPTGARPVTITCADVTYCFDIEAASATH